MKCDSCSSTATHKCGDCETGFYCSKKCQQIDWEEHQIACGQGMKPIAKIVKKDGRFDILENLLEEANLLDTFYGNGPFTVFAPTDDAFKRLPDGLFGQLMRDRDLLVQVLTSHVVSGKIMASDILRQRRGSVKSLSGAPINYDVSNGSVRINRNSTVEAVDVMASNGVIHIIDYPILPQ